MGVLGLNEPIAKDDNLFQRLFWPSDQPGEADALGVQGFWICVIVAVLSAVGLLATNHPMLGLLTAVFFVLGGIGVRERNVAAAVIVSVAYLINLGINLIAGMPPGVLTLIAAGMLLANIRATRIAAKWHDVEQQERFAEEGIVAPPTSYAKIWRGALVPFYVVSAVYLGLCILALAGLMMRKPVKAVPAMSTQGDRF